MNIPIPSAVTRSPRDILSEIFQIQGVALDPDDLETAVDRILGTFNQTHSQSPQRPNLAFDCFISYSMDSEKHEAEKLYLHFKLAGINPFLDRKCLTFGEPWKDGFIRGLLNSKRAVILISNRALAPYRAKTRDHSHDNMLLEMEIALQIKRVSENPSFVLPIWVGESVNGTLVKFNGFDPAMYSETVTPQLIMKPWWVAPPRASDGQRIAFFTKEFTENVLNGVWYPSKETPGHMFGEAIKREGGSYSWDYRDSDLDRMFAGRY